MVRCVPAEPDFATGAEREVWRAVKRRLGQDDALLANLRLTDEGGDYEPDPGEFSDSTPRLADQMTIRRSAPEPGDHSRIVVSSRLGSKRRRDGQTRRSHEGRSRPRRAH